MLTVAMIIMDMIMLKMTFRIDKLRAEIRELKK